MKTNDTHESVSRIAGRGLVLVGLLSVALAFAGTGFAQSNAAPAQNAAGAKTAQPAKAAANSRVARAAKAPRGTGEGIQIHGQWTVEIRNRDGSVARHVEFENALSGGDALLAGLLSGNLVAGSWFIYVSGEAEQNGVLVHQSPCANGAGCVILQAGSGGASAGNSGQCSTSVSPAPVGTQQASCYETLVTSLTGGNDGETVLPYSSFTLNGQAYVDTSTTLVNVSTSATLCGTTGTTIAQTALAPSSCFGLTGNDNNVNNTSFTSYSFGPTTPAGLCGGSGSGLPLCQFTLQVGQVISATVTFSFSSPGGDGQSPSSAVARRRAIVRAPNPAKPPVSTPVNR
jgi:hypothetical protein